MSARRTSDIFPRKPDFEIDMKTPEGITRYAEFYVGYAANVAGGCMTDHVRDENVVRDMHDIIGALSAVQNALQLLRTRGVTREQQG